MRQLLIDELTRAVSLADHVHPNTLTPQFRLILPHGHLRLAFPISSTASQKAHELQLVADLISLLMCPAFIATWQKPNLNAIIATRVDNSESTSALVRQTATPHGPHFGSIEWQPKTFIDDDALALRPSRVAAISNERAAEVSRWFGPTGKYPVHAVTADRTLQ